MGTADVKSGQDNATRTAILDAAEKLFAGNGFDGVSIRAIVKEAKVNNAAVFYYFGTTQALFEAVFERRAVALAEERLSRLQACLDTYGDTTPIESIIEAYLVPGLTTGFGSPEHRRHFAQIRARMAQASYPFMRALSAKHFAETGQTFLEALSNSLPDLPRRELQWRFHTMLATLVFTMSAPGRFQFRTTPDAPDYDPWDMEEAIAYLVPTMADMFRNPPRKDPTDQKEAARHV